ncbi:preprotein translocase subunit SecY [Bogoriella caseilytica]|uniref:Protein translocase subunit SecY n=1 Tax=Bogoriella caseilytica TaxID=56055 RepID=A0A3N2BET3_9MICO|nr:preprotein translocase subunit SecY [Bogoriella caseilytica]ROR73544.1 protein translocase subunit secY/sec61 alpha [Bogoriella caseilytica]
MLGAFVQAFRTPDLRRKLLFTLGIMALFRLGTYIPAPGVSAANIRARTDSTPDLLGVVDLFSGGALLQLSIFALGVMPYITASIIMQLMRVVIPRLAELHKEGQSGTAKITQYTRYLTLGLALLQASVFVTVANTQLFPGSPAVIPDDSWYIMAMAILSMTAGTALVMWMGEMITERGVGNGMSLMIFTSIAASFPPAFGTILESDGGVGRFAAVIGLILLITLLIVFVEQSQRRIPVQYAKRMVGRRMYGGSSTYIPIKINMANVIPVIFASSLLMLPNLAAQFGDAEEPWVQWLSSNFASPDDPLYLALFAFLILFFTFFYVSITFNPDDVADNMKRYGGFIPGIRAGRPTADYLQFVSSRITTVGAIYLTLVALIPTVVFAQMGIDQGMMVFGGTSVLIVVGVGLQTVKEIDSQLQQRHYEGFLG